MSVLTRYFYYLIKNIVFICLLLNIFDGGMGELLVCDCGVAGICKGKVAFVVFQSFFKKMPILELAWTKIFQKNYRNYALARRN